MNATQESTLKEDFLEWSGRTPPDSPFEIFTYCELSLPFGYDYEESRLVLKRWMELAWKGDPLIENPKDHFDALPPGKVPGTAT